MDIEPLYERFVGGQTFEEFLDSAQSLRDFWHNSAARAAVDAELVERAVRVGGG